MPHAPETRPPPAATLIRDRRAPGIWKLALGATGIVFGDIGTSPLYAFRESFIGHHRLPLDRFHVLGVLSLASGRLSSS